MFFCCFFWRRRRKKTRGPPPPPAVPRGPPPDPPRPWPGSPRPGNKTALGPGGVPNRNRPPPGFSFVSPPPVPWAPPEVALPLNPPPVSPRKNPPFEWKPPGATFGFPPADKAGGGPERDGALHPFVNHVAPAPRVPPPDATKAPLPGTPPPWGVRKKKFPHFPPPVTPLPAIACPHGNTGLSFFPPPGNPGEKCPPGSPLPPPLRRRQKLGPPPLPEVFFFRPLFSAPLSKKIRRTSPSTNPCPPPPFDFLEKWPPVQTRFFHPPRNPDPRPPPPPPLAPGPPP